MAVSLFGVGFLVFVFVVAVVSFLVVGFFVFSFFFSQLPLGIVVGTPTPNGPLKRDTRNRRQGPVEEDGLEI